MNSPLLRKTRSLPGLMWLVAVMAQDVPQARAAKPAENESEPHPMSTHRSWTKRTRDLEAARALAPQFDIQQVIDLDRIWETPVLPGPVRITVAFCGGTIERQREIVRVARKWEHGNHVLLDFGTNDGPFRQWSRWNAGWDSEVAQVRIALDGSRDSICAIGKDARLVPGNKETMSLAGFDQKDLPEDWQYIVLHEFGHALGLRHELQHPENGCPVRWENDEGYKLPKSDDSPALPQNGLRPGVYTFFAYAPTHWSRTRVEQELGIIKDAKLDVTKFDSKSVMIYPLARWLFVDHQAPCAGGRSELSEGDKQAIQRAYPQTQLGRMALRGIQTEFRTALPAMASALAR